MMVAIADVHKHVKNGINGKDSDTSLTGNDKHLKELAEVKKMLTEHKKKQDYIVTLLHHVCSKLLGSFPVDTTSGDVRTTEIAEAKNEGVYTLESSPPSELSTISDHDDYIAH